MPDAPTLQDSQKDADLDMALKKWLRANMRRRDITCEHLAQVLGKRLGRSISARMIETWVSGAKFDWHIPADAIPALAEILQDDGIQRYLLSERHRRALELGESTQRVCALLRKAMGERPKRKKG